MKMYYLTCFLCIVLCVNIAVSHHVKKTKENKDKYNAISILVPADVPDKDVSTTKNGDSTNNKNVDDRLASLKAIKEAYFKADQ